MRQHAAPTPRMAPRPPDPCFERMAGAGETVIECLRVLAKTGDNVVGEVLRGAGPFVEWEHFPRNDVYDPETHAQYYYHAHPPETRAMEEHGHFHLFLRPKGMPPGMRPARVPDLRVPAGDNEALCHLVAISMDRYGQPRRLFTTNRWVTGETWYAAEDAVAMLDRFVVEVARPNWIVNRWITAMVRLFRPTIARLLAERDRTLADWRAAHPGVNALEDRRLEIMSAAEIELDRQIAAVVAMIDAHGRCRDGGSARPRADRGG